MYTVFDIGRPSRVRHAPVSFLARSVSATSPSFMEGEPGLRPYTPARRCTNMIAFPPGLKTVA